MVNGKPPLPEIAIISGASLGYQLVLMKLFSIIHWHHFAYMIISLALLGIAVSGSLLLPLQQRLLPHFRTLFFINALLFGISAIACFLLAQQIPFNTLEILWDPAQWSYLFGIYLLLFLPFLFAANCILLALTRFPDQVAHIYAYNLLGAGLGTLATILVMFTAKPALLLQLIGLAVFTAALCYCIRSGLRAGLEWSGLILALAVATLLLPQQWLTLNINPYKEQQNLLRISGTKVIDELPGPLAQLTVVESRKIPLRSVAGLSLLSKTEPLPQLGVLSDGGSLSPITRYQGDRESLSYLDYLTSALPYHLRDFQADSSRVLLLAAGGGAQILQAHYHQAARIEAVELNPQMAELLQHRYADYAGWHHLKETKLHVAEARGFLNSSKQKYDLIQLPPMGSSVASGAGLYALLENHLYTEEALALMIERLKPDGLLGITTWTKLPPRDSLKLVATAEQALTRLGIEGANRHIAIIRSWKTATLLIKKQPFTTPELTQIRQFSQTRAFDLVYLPGISPQETNRYNRLQQPYFYDGVTALLSDRREPYIDRYKFDIAPATDNRPYFYQFFRWESLAELWSLRGKGGTALLEWGYPVLVATLLQALLASLVLIVTPLLIVSHNREQIKPGAPTLCRLTWYFLAIGFAFMFLEIAFIQKFTLFLSHPIFSMAAVVSGFLLFAGAGSHCADRLLRRREVNGRRIISGSVSVIAAVSLIYLFLLPEIFDNLAHLAPTYKTLITLLCIAPLAFAMGMPFPVGLTQVNRSLPGWLPWAWCINGCASVVGAVSTALLSIHFGFNAVLIGAALLYLSIMVVKL